MPMPSPAQVAQNWQRGMSNSAEKLKQGVQNVTQSPTAKAAMRIDAMVAGVQRAAASGKTAAALNAVSTEDWKKAMLEKGVPRVAAGASAAVPKFQQFMTKFLPWLQSGMSQLESMPRGDLEQNIARANTMMRHNAQFKNNS